MKKRHERPCKCESCNNLRAKIVRWEPEFARALLGKIIPFVEGYEAICQHLAQGEEDKAWELSRNLAKNSKLLKKEVLSLFPRKRTKRPY